MNKQQYINSIREEYSGMKDMPRESLASSLETLAHDLYAKDSHFIFELIQNAEDNNYPDKTAALLRFEVCQLEIERQKTTTLIVHNNEIGFNDKNVRAICQVGQSTKKKAQGYIGEKGIGFKSVFRITASPYIFSNGFQFRLLEHDDETGLGYIVPSWVLHPPKEIPTEETSIVLPLNKNNNDVDSVIKALRDIAPETILFLKKLEKLTISVLLPDCTSNYNLEIEKKVIKTIDKSQLVELTCKKLEAEKNDGFDSYSFWVTEIEFEKPANVQSKKRLGIETRVVSVAIPLDDKTTKGKLFAYLPVWEETGIPFLINADFLLVSSREGIREDEDWNKWLRDCVAKTYTSSLLSLLKTDKIPFNSQVTGYASIPVETHCPFLESVINDIKKELSDTECVFTLPDKLLVKPSGARLCYHNFRELLADTKTLPTHFIDTVQIVCPEMELFSEGLKSIGVKIFTTQDILCCLDDSEWLYEHETTWFIKLFRYLRTQQKLDSNSLQRSKIVPVMLDNICSLSCASDQPIYFSLNEEDKLALKDVPEWLSELAPIAQLNSEFEKLLNIQKDNNELLNWMAGTLRINKFLKSKYCDDVFSKLVSNRSLLSAEKLIGATQWLEQNVHDNFDWSQLPVVLSSGQQILLLGAQKLDLVVPETYDKTSGWQNIWVSSNDRAHFTSLSNSYCIMPREWFDKLKIKKFPEFKTLDYSLRTPPTSFPEVKLFEICRRSAAGTRGYETKVSSYGLPSTLISLPVEECALTQFSRSLLNLLTSLILPDPSHHSFKSKLYESYLYALGIYSNYGTHHICDASSVLYQIKQLKWLPTTKGFTRPSQAFLSKGSIKEILGDSVPYFEGSLPEYLLLLLEVRSEVTVTELLALLRDNSGLDNPDQELIKRLYDELYIRTEHNISNIKEIFAKESLIYISTEKQSKKWFTSSECVWEDATEILGNDFAYLENEYPKRDGFFISRLGVKERIDSECYANRWLKLQDEPLINLTKQRDLVTRLYREIKPVTVLPQNSRPIWWGRFVNKAKLYTKLDTFCNAADIIFSDVSLQNLLKDSIDVHFTWHPDNELLNDWMSFFGAFGVSLQLPEISAKRWLILQDAPLSDLKRQRDLLEYFYRKIKPVAQLSLNEMPGWWSNFFSHVKLYSESDTFCDATDIILPDDRIFQDMFRVTEDVEYAWKPGDDSFSEWKAFFDAFGVALLSESVTEKLIENVVPEFVEKNRYVTESAIKMIASWLKEKNRNEYDRFLETGVFEELLQLRESSLTSDIEIEFSLQTEKWIYDPHNGVYPAFWDRTAHTLYYNDTLEERKLKIKLSQVLAKPLTRNYKDLALWIEAVLGAENIERIRDDNWNVPREINDLFRDKKSLPESDKEPIEDTVPTTPAPSLENTETDFDSIESVLSVSSADENESDTEEHSSDTPDCPPPTPTTQTSTPSFKNKPDEPTPIIDRKKTILPDEKSPDASEFNFKESLIAAFTQKGATELNEDVMNRINSGDDGLLSKPGHREGKLGEEYLNNIKNEPTAEARRKETERSLLEPPNKEVRASLFDWYNGKCQICGETWPKSDGNPYFAAAYIVERQHKRYLDEPGNALCLCAKHFAQWRLAAKATTDGIMDQIGKLRLDSEGGDGDLSIHFQLVDKKVVIKLSERHALALRKLVEVAGILPTDTTNLQKDTNPNSDDNLSEKMSSPHIEPQVISPLTSSSSLHICPYCQVKVNSHKLETHMQKKCPKRPNNRVDPIIPFRTSQSINTNRTLTQKTTHLVAPKTQSNSVNSSRAKCKFCSNFPIPGSDVCYSCG